MLVENAVLLMHKLKHHFSSESSSISIFITHIVLGFSAEVQSIGKPICNANNI